MTNLNPTGAAARLLSKKSVVAHECLVAVGSSLLDGRPALTHAETALQAWDDTPGKQVSGAPRVNCPVYFAGPAGYGDVCLSAGGDVLAVIDPGGRWGKTGTQTIAERAAQVGGRYLGWSTEFLGYDLVVPHNPVPAPPKNATQNLVPGHVLGAGLSLYAGDYKLTMQLDTNLVLYKWNGEKWTVSKNFDTKAKGATPGSAYITNQASDNHVVVYGEKRGKRIVLKAFKYSKSAKWDGSILHLQADGNLTIQNAKAEVLWALR